MLKFNLWEASQFFYNFFEKKNIALKKIYDLN